jgi:hypothetical protein
MKIIILLFLIFQLLIITKTEEPADLTESEEVEELEDSSTMVYRKTKDHEKVNYNF